MNLADSLMISLGALQKVVQPALVQPQALSTLRLVSRILAHLAINHSAPGERERHEIDRIASILAAHGSAVFADKTIRTNELLDEANIPHAHFGGGDLHRTAAQIGVSDARRSSDGDSVLLSHLVDWELSTLNGISNRVQQLLQGASQRVDESANDRSEANARDLEIHLRNRYPSCPHLRVVELSPFSGGRSKFTAALTVAGCNELPTKMVYRQDRAINVTGGPSVEGEFALLRYLHESGLKVPQPYMLQTSDAPGVGAFILMSRLPGNAAADGLDVPYSRSVALALATELAKLHSLPFAPLQSERPELAAPTCEEALAELEGFERTWSQCGRAPSVSMSYALWWLKRNIHLATQGETSIVHRDALFHNVLAVGDELTGIIDWEFARIGYAAEDLGWCRAAVEGGVSWREFMSTYRAAGGRPLGEGQIDFYTVWAGVRLGTMCAYAHSLAASGATKDIEYVCVSFHEYQAVLHRLTVQIARLTQNLPR